MIAVQDWQSVHPGGVLTVAEHDAGGGVHRQQQGRFGAPVLRPSIMAAVHLDQHPSLGHPLAAGTADARSGENAPHREPAHVGPLPFPEQFGETCVVGALVASDGQFHHGDGFGGRDGIVGMAAAPSLR